MKLTQAVLATLAVPPGKSEAVFFDDDIPGFGIRIWASGTRSWVFQYRVGAKQYRQSLGSAKAVSATVARVNAGKLYARVKLGENPQTERQARQARNALTFAAAVEAYLEAKQPEWRQATTKVTRLYLTGSYFQPLRPMPLAEIGHPDIAARVSAITRNHSSHTASAARRAVSGLFKWTTEEGWTTTNPVVGTRKPTEVAPRERVLALPELVAIWCACSGDSDHDRIIRLLTLLGSRRQEVGGMRWSEFDFDAGTWTLPKERAKNGREHTIMLPPTALAIIRSAPRGDRDRLFGDRSDTGFTLWTQAKRELDRRLGDTVKPWRIHDLRRSVATHMAGEVGIEPHIIEAVLNHYSGHRRGVAGVYNRSSYKRAVGAALARWSEHVIALVEGQESNVVALHSA
jgi:integrase